MSAHVAPALLLPGESIQVGQTMVSAVHVGLPAAAVGSLLPDLDSPTATLAQLSVGRVAGVRIRPLLPVALILAAISGGHRKGTHTIWPVLLCWMAAGIGLLAHPVISAALLALSLGYAIHLLLDMCTLSGLAVFAPLSNEKYHALPGLLRVRTGSAGEMIFVAVWGGLLGIVAVTLGWVSGTFPYWLG